MTIAWFICQYKVKAGKSGLLDTRYCAMDDFTPLIITQDGGNWSESEVLGAYAVVKVNASDATLATINGTANFTRIPNHIQLSDTLGDLTTNQRNTLLALLQDMGYTLAEISGALGDNLAGWRNHTLGQVLRFAASRRLKPRWDDVQQQIVLDGILQACRPIDDVDAAVQ